MNKKFEYIDDNPGSYFGMLKESIVGNAKNWLIYKESKSPKETEKLNESSDGWDESKLQDLLEILDKIYNLQYEVQNTVKGAYTKTHTYEELGYYVQNLGSNLMDIGDEIMEMEEENEEDED